MWSPTDVPGEDQAARDCVAAKLRQLQHRLAPLRVAGWLAQACVAGLLLTWLLGATGDAKWWLGYGCALAIAVAVFHVLPAILWRLSHKETRVSPRGENAWRIGRYTGAEILAAFERATCELPLHMRRIGVRVAKMRGIQGWTMLNLIWPAWGRAPVIRVSSGALHYLEPGELEALLLHEVGHHVSRHRLGPPGGWLLVDLCLASLLFSAYSNQVLGVANCIWTFLFLKGILVTVVVLLTWCTARQIEHACDLFAASRVGSEPVANLLLKSGEECELIEAVLALAARQLLYVRWLDVDDLALAFQEVRPEGRIFHESLFRHSVALVEWLTAETGIKLPSNAAKRRKNADLAAFLAFRRKRNRCRIRWRRYDADGDGALSLRELNSLVEALRQRPDDALVVAEQESQPTSHPSFRDRLMTLAVARPK